MHSSRMVEDCRKTWAICKNAGSVDTNVSAEAAKSSAADIHMLNIESAIFFRV
jgi:hypothetical protein